MSVDSLIRNLKDSKLVAECPCGEKFRLSQAVLFNGLGTVPPEAVELKDGMLQELKDRIEELKKRKVSAVEGAEQKAIEVGIGKIVEKIIPTYADFKIPVSDCRPLFEPIDMIAFNGLTQGRMQSITFLEIKTGGSKLNKHQKCIKEAVEDKRVSYKEL